MDHDQLKGNFMSLAKKIGINQVNDGSLIVLGTFLFKHYIAHYFTYEKKTKKTIIGECFQNPIKPGDKAKAAFITRNGFLTLSG